MNVRYMVKQALIRGGYGGLYNEDGNTCGEYGCEISDLAPCGSAGIMICEAAYRGACIPEDCEQGGNCEFHMYLDEEDAIASLAKEEAK